MKAQQLSNECITLRVKHPPSIKTQGAYIKNDSSFHLKNLSYRDAVYS